LLKIAREINGKVGHILAVLGIWTIWRQWNDWIFRQKEKTTDEVFFEIEDEVYL